MSADNTIGVLATNRPNGKGLEFRVAHAQAIEDMDYEPDYPPDHPVFNRVAVLAIWGESEVFNDHDQAMIAAEYMEAEHGYVEYGIVVFYHSRIHFPASDAKLRQRAHYRAQLRRLRHPT